MDKQNMKKKKKQYNSLLLFLLCFFLPLVAQDLHNCYAAGDTDSVIVCRGKILPKKGIKSSSIRHKSGVRVVATFYMSNDSAPLQAEALTDSDGAFCVPVPSKAHGRIAVSFNTYRNGKSKGYLVEIDRRDGRSVRDETAHPMVLKDSLGYDVYIFDMQRESELCLLRGEKIGYLPKWLVKQSPIKEAYYKERRAIAWNYYKFSLYNSPTFKIKIEGVPDNDRNFRIVHYRYSLFEASYYPYPFRAKDIAIIDFGGPRLKINELKMLHVSMAPYKIPEKIDSPHESYQLLNSRVKEIANYNPMKTNYGKTRPMVYTEGDTFYTYLDVE